MRTLLPARMRSESGWSDACILNISSRGLLVYSSGFAPAGSFVEIRRGGQLVIARVVWRQNQRIGLCSPDRVHVQDIIGAETAAPALEATPNGDCCDRRRVARHEEDSRSQAQAIQFIAAVLFGAALAFAALHAAKESFARPIAQLDKTLGRR